MLTKAMAPPVDVNSTVGAGDSAVAGFVLAHCQGKDMQGCLQLACAAGTATAQTPGTELCHSKDVKRILPLVNNSNLHHRTNQCQWPSRHSWSRVLPPEPPRSQSACLRNSRTLAPKPMNAPAQKFRRCRRKGRQSPEPHPRKGSTAALFYHSGLTR